ncbi:YmfQ family protein [Sphingomonas hengshuiensis]|uniref:YmfQ family protein n=1 Tax=Sphingomonas hengshuiensis TaxID=1609977 RepID=UPI0006968359|nr:putative phage tail protein [Sphingomonas hengshuiensis]
MTYTAAQYRDQLVSLLPPGAAWGGGAVSPTLGALLEGWSAEFERLDLRVEQLGEEVDPRTAYELLGDWERNLGLPDPCTAAATTISGRQSAALRKLALQAGQTPAFYTELAASIGFEVVIHEFDPDVDAYDASLTALIGGGAWRYVWRVEVLNAGDFTYARIGDAVGTRLVEGDAALDLECLLHAAKPAHTVVIFSYPET